jgi:hypothetical protein
LVDRHIDDIQYSVDRCDPQSNLVMYINIEAETSEDPRSIISGNNDEYLRVNEIVINFTETWKSYDLKSICWHLFL